jgi:hypothetical protein
MMKTNAEGLITLLNWLSAAVRSAEKMTDVPEGGVNG